MKKIYTSFIMSLFVLAANSQVFWTENFGTGCNQGQLASAFTGANGLWSIASTGTNDPFANTFFVGAQEAGNAVGACGTGCTGTIDASLHVGNVALTSPIVLAADNGASYNSGGLCSAFSICVITNKRAVSPIINCSGRYSNTISFGYMENGSTTVDDATLWYSPDAGVTFTLLDNMAKTPFGTCSPQGKWAAYSFALPASANNNAFVKIAFNWTNNDDGIGTDPSFAVDDVVITAATSTGISNLELSDLQIYSVGKNIIVKSNELVNLIGVFDVLGRTINSSIQNNAINLENQNAGIYFVKVLVNGQTVTRKIAIN